MKIATSRERCIGAGICLFTAPDVFDQDDEALVVLIHENPPDSLRGDALTAASHCPSQAITVDGQ
ncbi:MAG: ferredoxin [Amycolatopsis sp.]|jgi:ferredoxin|uniref:ferredoxin n=1 Tax=Amycolatopsis sp. TaxID=37632 RepID=UPI002629A7DC|nr:ferredoxin [Amycolatopsis sp.]MCU1687466.1 ferredoxin [Amycolatopsis sp.]